MTQCCTIYIRNGIQLKWISCKDAHIGKTIRCGYGMWALKPCVKETLMAFFQVGWTLRWYFPNLTFIMSILTHTNCQFPLIPEGIMANSISSLKAKFCFLTIYGSYATKEHMVKWHYIFSYDCIHVSEQVGTTSYDCVLVSANNWLPGRHHIRCTSSITWSMLS
jgi:hypothetical protein